MTSVPSYRQMLLLALPIILANSATPLLGLVDTAVIGNVGTVADLGAIALGGLLFNFLFWGFGFLRMSTSGYVAQATGRGDALDITATVLRGLVLAIAIGLILILFQWPLLEAAMWLFGAGEQVQETTRAYFKVRIWGAPASLALYVLMGFFIGSGASRRLLLAQLLLNGLNIVLDIVFAGWLGWGARGIALGTVLAEWCTVIVTGAWIGRQLSATVVQQSTELRRMLADRAQLRQIMQANGDILLRTLALLLGFALFTDQGARFGDATLAANHILLQLISFSAFFLDGFAYTTEALAGRAWGSGRYAAFAEVVRRSSWLAAATAILLAIVLLIGGGPFIQQLTDLEEVRQLALRYLPLCALYVLVSFAAFQLDGIFIGTTQTRPLRNASLISTGIFAAAMMPLVALWGNAGLWAAFIVFVLARSMTLAAWYRARFSTAAMSHSGQG